MDRMRGVAPRMVVRVLAIVMALVGLWLLVQSPLLGLEAAGDFLRRQGGSASTDVYHAVLEAYAAMYRLLSAVLLGVGAATALRPA